MFEESLDDKKDVLFNRFIFILLFDVVLTVFDVDCLIDNDALVFILAIGCIR